MGDKENIYSDATSFLKGAIIQTSSGDLKAPESIVLNVAAARQIYSTMYSQDIDRLALYSAIEGMIGGNPPFDPAELAEHGLGHVANFNTLDVRALYDKNATGFWNLINETDNLVKFVFFGEDPELIRYADIMAENWTEVIRMWPSFQTSFNILAAQIVKFGISPVVWSSPTDWAWRPIKLSDFRVPDQTQVDIELITKVAIEAEYTFQYLFSIWERFKNVSTAWNREALEQYLLNKANNYIGTQNTRLDNVFELQLRIQNNDSTLAPILNDSVRLVNLFYKEYSGKISQFMFDPYFDTAQDFLYADRNSYNNLGEVVTIFTANPGEFTIHSNKGVGTKALSMGQAMMQMDCNVVNGVAWANTPMLKTLPGVREIDPIRWYVGSPTNVGTAEVVQNNVGMNIQASIGASQYFASKLAYNNGISGDDPSSPDASKGSQSRDKAKSMAFKEFGFNKNSIAHFYSQWDSVVRNMVVRMLDSTKTDANYDYAEEWKKRCIDQGVPKQLFDNRNKNLWGVPRQFRKIQAARAAADGSTVGIITGLQGMADMGALQSLSARGQKEATRLIVRATMGSEYVPSFLSGMESPDENAGGASLAELENGLMELGKAAKFSPDNEQRTHIISHINKGKEIIQRQLQQETTPMESDPILTLLTQHTAQHIEYLSKSPFAQNFMQSVLEDWKDIVKYTELNKKNAGTMLQSQLKKQKEAEANQQKVMTEEELKNFQVMNDEKRKDLKVQNQVQRASEANKTRADVMLKKVEEDAKIASKKVDLEADNTRRKNSMEASNEALKQTREQIVKLSGQTPSPYDLEGV